MSQLFLAVCCVSVPVIATNGLFSTQWTATDPVSNDWARHASWTDGIPDGESVAILEGMQKGGRLNPYEVLLTNNGINGKGDHPAGILELTHGATIIIERGGALDFSKEFNFTSVIEEWGRPPGGSNTGGRDWGSTTSTTETFTSISSTTKLISSTATSVTGTTTTKSITPTSGTGSKLNIADANFCGTVQADPADCKTVRQEDCGTIFLGGNITFACPFLCVCGGIVGGADNEVDDQDTDANAPTKSNSIGMFFGVVVSLLVFVVFVGVVIITQRKKEQDPQARVVALSNFTENNTPVVYSNGLGPVQTVYRIPDPLEGESNTDASESQGTIVYAIPIDDEGNDPNGYAVPTDSYAFTVNTHQGAGPSRLSSFGEETTETEGRKVPSRRPQRESSTTSTTSSQKSFV